ncbi:MAG: hypothetical protein ACPF9K_04580 [Neptuniibacter sp.]
MAFLYPEKRAEAFWDEVCIDRIVEYPARWEFRAIYGLSERGERLILQGYPENAIEKIKGILSKENKTERCLQIGWYYPNGPFFDVLFDSRFIVSAIYENEEIIKFEEQYNFFKEEALHKILFSGVLCFAIALLIFSAKRRYMSRIKKE